MQGEEVAGDWVTGLAPASRRILTLAWRPVATPLERSAEGARVSKRFLMPWTKVSVSAPARRRVRPGLVQNWPLAARAESANSSAIFSGRSLRAPGRINTGLREDI